ncbi:MAG TPA: PAS domain S-box protein [Longimicrobiales bacterium]|nr:PAS domain S-box protein [Longimicrobiales bacterium]
MHPMESFRALASAAPDAIVAADSEGAVTYANPAAERTFGWTSSELAGRPLTVLMPERFREAHRRGLARFRDTGESRVLGPVVELVGLRKDGTEFPVELSLGSWKDERGPAFVGVLRDIAERTQMREALARQSALLDAVLNSVREGVVAADPDGRFLLWNPAAERLVGAGPTERPLTEWPEHYGVFRDDAVTPYPAEELPLARAIRGESVDDDVQYVVRPSGPAEGTWLAVTARPLTDDYGRHMGGVVTLTDVTEERRVGREIRRLSEALEEQVEGLERANEELQAFSYTVSHDLRAPLRAVQGFAQALEEDYADVLDEQGRDYTHRMVAAAVRMDHLIQDLLDYSRLAQDELRLTDVGLDDAIGAAVEQLQVRIEESGASLEIAPGLPSVRAHPGTLAQVFANLLANAMTFVAEGTRPQVRVRWEGEDGRARIIVEDNGIGIDPEHQERVFRVFERLHGTESYPGTGIGLAIVRKAMQRMGGRAGVESAPGRGSRFWIELPTGGEGP